MVCKSGIANGIKQLDLALRLQEGRMTDLAADYCAGPEYEASMGIFVMGRGAAHPLGAGVGGPEPLPL